MRCVMLVVTILDVWAHSIITPHTATLHKLQDTGQIKVRRWDDVMLLLQIQIRERTQKINTKRVAMKNKNHIILSYQIMQVFAIENTQILSGR